MALAAIDTVPITDKAADFQTEDLPADKAETPEAYLLFLR